MIAINMMDIVRKNGDKINVKKLSETLGCEIIEISALKGEGGFEAAQKAVDAAEKKQDATPLHVFTGSVEHAIAHIEESIEMTVDHRYLRWFVIILSASSSISFSQSTMCCSIWAFTSAGIFKSLVSGSVET